jgi:CheY-like chemotaxis protein
VVDDNPVNRELVRGFFDMTHHRLSEAADGREAIESILRDKPDLVLMDIRMPVMDGRTALKELRSHGGFDLLPVIAVTASSMAGEEGALRESFNGYVRKPYSRSQLYQQMSHFIPHTSMEVKRREAGAAAAAPVSKEWAAMIPQLRKMERDEWPQVRDGMLISEVRQFATTLSSLGQRHECPPLVDYAGRLERQALDFSLAELEKSLAQYPDLVSQWETRSHSLS